MKNLHDIIIKQSEIIINNCKIAMDVTFPEELIIIIPKLSKYDINKLVNDLNEINYWNCIYIISADEFKMKKEAVTKTFLQLKSQYPKNYHISRINDSVHWLSNNSEKILYVGCKENNLQRRLMQHLGIINKKSRSVYSLYLNDWWLDHSKLIIKIWNLQDKVNNAVLQIIEDSIWEELHPLFGKKGATFNKKNA